MRLKNFPLIIYQNGKLITVFWCQSFFFFFFFFCMPYKLSCIHDLSMQLMKVSMHLFVVFKKRDYFRNFVGKWLKLHNKTE